MPQDHQNCCCRRRPKSPAPEMKTCLCAALRSAQTRGWVHLSQDLKYQPAEWRPRRPKQAKLCFGARKRSHQNLIAHRNASSSGAASDGPIGGPATPGEDPGASAIKPPHHWRLGAAGHTEGFLRFSAQEFLVWKAEELLLSNRFVRFTSRSDGHICIPNLNINKDDANPNLISVWLSAGFCLTSRLYEFSIAGARLQEGRE